MKLYVQNKRGKRIYINKVASTKLELKYELGRNEFSINGERYYIRDVRAQKDTNDTYIGIIVGGILGLIVGPLGIIVGGATGGIIGSGSDARKLKHVKKFNRSKIK
ncbi:hypothetical protein DMA11_23625 [Marinilabiliaceae bacterium JC017]|nr:hypothetical protein DMA11_23625 [Marinilabiliaceae bacterium JC017]